MSFDSLGGLVQMEKLFSDVAESFPSVMRGEFN